jgi:uncharacterized membrane protein YphA (DoxX/SURF4 family)
LVQLPIELKRIDMDKLAIEIGRVLFALLFIGGGIGHFAKLEAMTAYSKYKKIPAPKLGVIVTGLFILLGGLSVLFGLWVDLGSVLLIIFLLSAAFFMHNYWTETDEMAKQTQQAMFSKNLALAGASLILLGLSVKGHGITADNFGWVISKAHTALWK